MSIPNRKVIVKDLDLIRYKNAWDLQEKILKSSSDLKLSNRREPDSAQPVPNYLLFCEHPHVYTLGKSGDEANILLTDEELKEKGIEYFRINRGGDITYHGPGQIVGYPIFDLENFQPDLHEYLRSMEEAVILTLADYGIVAGRIAGLTGVWIDMEGDDPRKILAIGVRASRWITMHGFAFNVNADLSYFANIIPCGIEDKGVTSMEKELGRKMDMQDVKDTLLSHLAHVFGFTWEFGELPFLPDHN